MADTTTTNYNLTKPQVGGSDGTWGGKTNDNWDVVDSVLHAVEQQAATNATVSHTLSAGTPTGTVTVQEAFNIEQTKIVYGGNF